MDFNKMIQGMKEKEAKEENPKNVEAKEPNDFENPVELDKQDNLGGKPIAPKPKMQYGGIAGVLQKVGLEPEEVDDEKQYIRVKDKAGNTFEIKQGQGWTFDVFQNGQKTHQNIPNHADFENLLMGKKSNFGYNFDKYKTKPAEPQQAPKEEPQEAPKLQEQPQEKPTVEASFSAKMNKPIQKSKYGTNEYETEDGEEWFIGTEEEAYEAAKEDIRNFVDDVGYGGFTDNFKDWIYANAVDSDFLADLRSEEADYFRGEGENEQAELIENMDDSETISYLEDIYGGDIGKFLEENNAIDFDKVAEEAISWDGIAHFLASYDGDEVELPNGLYAYRRN